MTDTTTDFPLDAYLERIGYSGSTAPDEQTLEALQRAQLATIPFENFDILLGRSISLAPAALVEKLIERPRGGYCFELNGLFLLALGAIGFVARPLLARVHLRGGATGRTHELLLVELAGQSWIADVGFGGPALRAPVPLELDVPRSQHGETFRLVDAGMFGTMLQKQGADGWRDLYSFELGAVIQADIELAHHFTSTHPHSRFTTTRIAAIHHADGRTTLEDRRLRRISEEADREDLLAEGPAYLEALSKHFGIDLGVPYTSLQPLRGL
jgi:N-hydroxyarylamine O-acetyltransferase